MLAGRAIAYAVTTTLIRRWAADTGADPDGTRAAIAFLAADIAGVAAEFDLLATGILDEDSVPAAVDTGQSRSIALPTSPSPVGNQVR